MRCEGGKLYINYLDKILKCTVDNKEQIQNYDIKVFDNPNEIYFSPDTQD